MQDLKSTYKADMRGVDLYLETEFKICKKFYSVLSFNGAYIKYKAMADWNLQDIFMHPLSFSQTSTGNSTGIMLELGYKVKTNISLTLGRSYAKTKVFKGIDEAYLVTNKQVSTQFNGASHRRYSSIIGLEIDL